MISMPHTPRRLSTRIDFADDSGQTLSEYSVLVAFIAIAAVLAVPGVATAVEALIAPATSFFGG